MLRISDTFAYAINHYAIAGHYIITPSLPPTRSGCDVGRRYQLSPTIISLGCLKGPWRSNPPVLLSPFAEKFSDLSVGARKPKQIVVTTNRGLGGCMNLAWSSKDNWVWLDNHCVLHWLSRVWMRKCTEQAKKTVKYRAPCLATSQARSLGRVIAVQAFWTRTFKSHECWRSCWILIASQAN